MPALLGAIGLTCMTAGLVLTALLPPDPSAADIMWRLVLCGAGFGIFAAPNNRLMMNAVPRERSGSAGGIIASARTLGQTMGAALVALVFGLFDFSGGGAADAARAAIWLGAGFAATALILEQPAHRHGTRLARVHLAEQRRRHAEAALEGLAEPRRGAQAAPGPRSS